MKQFIRDNAMMWLEEFRIDGLRFDTTLFIRSVRADGADFLSDGLDLCRWINADARGLQRNNILIAEDLQNDALITEALDDGGAGFNSLWDAAFVHPVRDVLIQSSDEARSMQKLCDALSARYNDDAFRRVVYTESHDEVANGQARVPYEIYPGDETGYHAYSRSAIGACLALTAPGIPTLFQGQEFLEGGWFSDDKAVDWRREVEMEGAVLLYKDLLAARLNRSGRTTGLTGQNLHIVHCNEDQKILAYHRWKEGGLSDDVMVVVNLSSRDIRDYKLGFPKEGLWVCIVNSASPIYECGESTSEEGSRVAGDLSYDGLAASASVCIAPYSFQIFSLQREPKNHK